MYICYGISNGPYYNGPREIWEESPYLWRADPRCGLVVWSKDELVLTVPEFDPTKATLVRITLHHKPTGALMIELRENSCLMNGKPELVWGERRD